MSAKLFFKSFVTRKLNSYNVLTQIKKIAGIRNLCNSLTYQSNNSVLNIIKSTEHCINSNNVNIRHVPFKIFSRHMAGHAKWQNIQFTKSAKDREKARLCDKYARLARSAIREGGPDPKLNNRLAEVIAQANNHNVPKSTLEGAMKGSQTAAKMKDGTIEIIGPGGCFLVLEYETSNISITRHAIKLVVRKYSAAIPAGEGRWRAIYEQKGLIKVIGKADIEVLESDKALDVAIEAGAEDVQINKDENDRPYFDFFCDPDDLHLVKKELENMKFKIEEAYVAYIPNVTVQLSPQDMQDAGNFISELEDLIDTVRVYENIQ